MIIVICVDRDDDIGNKAEIKTPVIGRGENIRAALALASKDPEDSDINTILGGVHVYDELISRGEEVEIASIAGDVNVGIKSDRKIADQIDVLKKELRANHAIVVTDGAEDEFILPIIQSRMKVDAVRRIIVKQSQSVENTYYLMKRMLSEPKISRLIFIPIGLVCLAIAISIFSGHPGWAIGLIVGFIGVYLLSRGFGFDTTISDFAEMMKESLYRGQITFITHIAAIVIIIVATAVGLAEAFSVANMPGNADNYLKLTMVFVNESIWWYISAFLLSGAGRIINGYIEDREWKHLSFPLFVFASGLILWGGSVCILSIEKDFSHGILYLLIAIIGAVIMSLIGVWISKYTMKAQAQAL